MNEKKLDKDSLMTNLAQYLSEEYSEYVDKKEDLITQRYEIEEEKETMIRSITSRNDSIRMREVFSPLTFQTKLEEEDKPDTTEYDKKINQLNRQISKNEKKLNQLRNYLKGLNDTFLIVSNEQEDDEKVFFLDSMYDLLDHIKTCHPDIIFTYDKLDVESTVYLTFSYLTGFHKMIKYLLNEIVIQSFYVDFFVDKRKIMVQFTAKPKGMKDNKYFYDKKDKLEPQLTKEFSITRWKPHSIVIQAVID